MYKPLPHMSGHVSRSNHRDCLRRALCAALPFVLSALCVSEASAGCTNGIYVTATGLASSIPIEELSQRLRRSNVDHVYVYRLDSSDGWQRSRLPGAMRQVRGRVPGIVFIGMLGRIAGPAATLKRAAAIWELGFDGVQLDFEPVASGDRNLIDVLELLRDEKPEGKIISLAGYLIADNALPDPPQGKRLLVWDEEYYRRLIALVDDLMVMNYDTAIRSRERYVASTTAQTRRIGTLVDSARVRLNIGIITDVAGRTGLHDRKAESFSSAIEGIRAAWPTCPDNAGVALFTWDGTRAGDWGELARWSGGSSVP